MIEIYSPNTLSFLPLNDPGVPPKSFLLGLPFPFLLSIDKIFFIFASFSGSFLLESAQDTSLLLYLTPLK